MKRINLLNYTLNELKVVISDYGYPVYRAEQIFISLHKKLNSDSSKIIGIPKVLKENINNDFYIGKIELAEIKKSTNDDTEKYLFQLPSGEKIETVLIIEKDRRTICVSTQAGCNVGCEFCATGKMGFKKNLDTSQIISQIYEVIQNTGEPPTNIVYMGMGEPFLNYENFINSLLIITDKNGLALPSKRITVSTVGFKDKLRKFTNDILKEENNRIKKIKLAFSLHSTDNGFRESLIPSSRNNKLKDIYNELVYFYSSTKNKITYEYIFLEGLNDTKEDIKRIVNLSKMIPCNFNIIPFHPIQFEFGEPLKKFNCNYSEKIFGNRNSLLNKKIFDFIKELKSMGVVVNLRTSNGSDIYAACGQLAGRE